MKRSSKKVKSAALSGKTELRRHAEAQLRNRKGIKKSEVAATKYATDTQRLLHELQVHQIELELQNEELQKAQNVMAEGLDKYTELYDFAPVGYFTLTAKSTIQMVNLTGARLVGVDRSKLLGRPLSQYILSNLHSDLPAFLKRVFAREVKQSCEVMILCEGQPPRAANIEARRSPNGQECHAIAMDLSDRQRASDAVMRLAAVVQNTDDAIYTLTFKGIIISWNKGAERMFGYSAQEMLGQNISKVVPPARAGESDALIQKLLDGKRVMNFETERMTKNRSLVSVSLSISLLRDQAGKVTNVSVIARDITESKQASEKLRRLEVLAISNQKLEQEIIRRQTVEDHLKQSERHQRQLLEQAHHAQEQLRQLSRKFLQSQEDERKRISRELHDVVAQTLAGINVRLASLKKVAMHNTKGLNRNIDSTQRMVDKSVDVIHRFARDLRPAVLDDLGLIPALHSYLKIYAAQTGLRVHLKAFSGVEKLGSAKRTVLYRVAQEALTNIDHHAHASRVDVLIQQLPGAVNMRITDDGRSFKVNNVNNKRNSKRLGLLGMRERLEMVGGTFSIESTSGKGTTVVALIPIDDEPKES